nr:uncharacterized protein LOC128681070 isoform X1 [Plodia interpunctella]
MTKERGDLKKYKHTKAMFKKANPTVSRTNNFIDTPQRYTKSIITQMKKDISQHVYNVANENQKRDLGIETGNCKLRRYYKYKLNKYGNTTNTPKFKNARFDISRYSRNSKRSFANTDSLSEIKNTDPTVILIENLRNLLKAWIEINLASDSKMNHAFDSIIDSIQNKLFVKDNKDNSCTSSTFIKDISSLEMTIGKTNTACSGSCQICKRKFKHLSSRRIKKLPKIRSCYVSRTPHNPIRLISTLSVPRKICNATINEKHKIKKLEICRSIITSETSILKTSSMSGHTKSPPVSNIYALTASNRISSINENLKNKMETSKTFITSDTSEVKQSLTSVCSKQPSTSDFYALTGSNHYTQTNVHMFKVLPHYCSFSRTSNNKHNSDIYTKCASIFDHASKITITNSNNTIDMKKKEVFTMTESMIDHNSILLMAQRHEPFIENNSCKNVLISNSKYANFHKPPIELSPLNYKKNNLTKTSITRSNKSILQTKLTTTNIYRENKIYKDKAIKYHTKRNQNSRKNRKRHVQKNRRNWSRDYDNISKNHNNTGILGHVEETIKYFFESNGSRNIKFDVNINVHPLMDYTIKESSISSKSVKCNSTNYNNNNKSVNTPFNNIVENSIQSPALSLSNTNNTFEFYPILNLPDQAPGHVNISKCENSVKQKISDRNLENINLTTEEILELKTIIKNISYITEKLLHQHTRRKIGLRKITKSNAKPEDKFTINKPSQIQPSSFDKAEVEACNKKEYTIPSFIRTKDISKALAPLSVRHKKIETVIDKTIELQTKHSTKHTHIYNDIKIPVNFSNKTVEDLHIITKRNPAVDSRFKEIQNFSKIEDPVKNTQYRSNFKVNNKNAVTPSYNTHRKIDAQTSAIPVIVYDMKDIGVPTQTKGIQISTINANVSGQSGSEYLEPRKTNTFNKNIISDVSYEIIENETVIRVTDMTVGEGVEFDDEKSEKVKFKSLSNLPTPNLKETTFHCDSYKRYEYIEENDKSHKNGNDKIENLKMTSYEYEMNDRNSSYIDQVKQGDSRFNINQKQGMINAPFSSEQTALYCIEDTRRSRTFGLEKGLEIECTKGCFKIRIKPRPWWKCAIYILCILIIVGGVVGYIKSK